MFKVQFPFNDGEKDPIQEPNPNEDPANGVTGGVPENENNDGGKDQPPTSPDAGSHENKGEAQPASDAAGGGQPEPEQPDFVSLYNKQFGTDFKSIDDIKNIGKETEVKKSVPKPEQPKEPEDKDLQAFNKFRKETNLGFKDFSELNKDWDKVGTLDAVRSKIREENKGMSLTNSQIDKIIAKKYQIDLSEGVDGLDEDDQLTLQIDANKFIQDKKSLLEKYYTTEEKGDPEPGISQEDSEMVTVNGKQVPKSVYLEQRQAYLNERNNALKEIQEASFGITIDEKGEKKELNFKYEYTDEDRVFASSLSEDISSIPQKFIKEGKFNHKDFNEGLNWMFPEFREKAIQSLLDSAFAAGIDSAIKDERNVNFDKRPAPKQHKEENTIDVDKIRNALGGGLKMKFPFNS